MVACPFGVPEYYPAYDMMMKCDLCYDRTSVGSEPMCTSVCPSQALWFGTPEEFYATRQGTLSNEFQFGNRTVRTKVQTVVHEPGPLDALLGRTSEPSVVGDPFGIGWGAHMLALYLMRDRRLDDSRALAREALARFRESHDVTGMILAAYELGLIAGYFRGPIDMLLMRIADVQLTFPSILLALLIFGIARGFIPPGYREAMAIWVLIIAIGLSDWVQYARVVRGATMVEKGKEYQIAPAKDVRPVPTYSRRPLRCSAAIRRMRGATHTARIAEPIAAEPTHHHAEKPSR